MKTFIASCFLVLMSVLPAYAQKVLPTSADKSRAESKAMPESFDIGDIKLAWEISGSEEPGKKDSVIIFIRRFNCVTAAGEHIPKGLKFAVVEKGEISDIENPAALDYQDEIPIFRSVRRWKDRVPLPKTLKPGDFERFTAPVGIRITCDEILCLQLGNKYAALKPTKIEINYLPWDKATKKDKELAAKILRETVKVAQSVPRTIEIPKIVSSTAMDYDWAYWSRIAQKKKSGAKAR